MNKLFPIPLLGQGTADIESLSSYVLRVAYEHGVSVGTLFSAVIEMSKAESRLEYHSDVSGRAGIEILARVNKCSSQWRRLFTELTGQDLFCGALQFLSRSVYCISTDIGGIRWCPECFSEMSRIDMPRYIKQIWHMKAVDYCPLHRTRLESVCPCCGSVQHSMRAETPLGWCMNCDFNLGERKGPLSLEDIQPSWECMSLDLVEIFEKTARDLEDMHCFRTSDIFIRDTTSTSEDWVGDGRTSCLAIEVLRTLRTPQRQPLKLISLRRLAYMMNMSLYEMLTSPLNVLNLPAQIIDVKTLPDQIKIRKKIARNHQSEYQRIMLILESQASPPSLKQLARLAKLSVGYLEYRFPGLVRKVVDRHKAYQDQQYLKRRYRAQTAALKFFIDDRYSAYSQSRKEAYRVLREETGLPKWLLKDAIQVAYRAIYEAD
ncbi:MAG TPA: hypothetical protein DIW64_05480 [Cellvibrio sp.]|nr:hypothetical protein [Cellvibrio sp.]